MRLNKLLFTVALFTVCFVSAQKNKIQFGVKIGLNRSEGLVNDAHEIKFKSGYHIGGFIEYSLTSKFGLQTGLLLTEKGGDFIGLNSGSYVGGTPDYKNKIKALYLKIPLSIIYKYKIKGDLNINLGAGTYIAYGISGRSRKEITGVYSDGTNFREWDTFIEDDRYADESLKNVDIGIILNCELEYHKIFLGIGIENGLVNTLRQYKGYGQELKLYNFNIPISIGYKF